MGEGRGEILRRGRRPERQPVRLRSGQGPYDGLAGAPAEHVLALGAHQRGGARSVLAPRQHQVATATDDRHGPPGELALCQLCGPGQLVGHRGEGDDERVAVRVAATGEVLGDHQPRGADGDVGLALAPGPPGGVGDDHGDVHPGEVGDLATQGAGRVIGVEGQQHDRAGRDVGGVDTGRRHGEAQPVSRDAGRTAAGEDAERLLVDRRLAVPDPDAPLGLADDLARDRDDVPVRQVGPAVQGREHQRREVVTGGDLGHPVGCPDLESTPSVPGHLAPAASDTAAAAMAAVASWSLIIRGTAWARSPASSSRGSWSASRESTSQPSSTPPPDRAP